MIEEKGWTKEMELPLLGRVEHPFSEQSKRPVFSIDTPPPYVNTPVHVGHAATYALMDMFARFHRMTGHEVLFPLGLDRNGLPIEVAAEKRFNIRPGSVPREEFIAKCRQVLEEASAKSTETFRRLGISFNSYEPPPAASSQVPEAAPLGSMYFTDSPEYRALTQATFIQLWKRGLIYEAKRLNNYCPGCRTTVADNEVDRKTVTASLNHIQLTVQETGEKLVIATTRPELLCTAALILYHPDDSRYAHLGGSHATIPIYNTRVPIKAHPIADPAFGTGLMYMSASAGDQDAVRFLREQSIEPVSCITTEARMDSNAGPLAGLPVKQARAKMIELLKAAGALLEQESIEQSTPICERSKDTIEYITMPELYLKQVEALDALRAIAERTNFFSPKSKQLLLDWINAVSIDWAISRRRIYATEIPLWYCETCAEPIVPPPGRYYQPWKEPAPIKACPKCGNSRFRGEDRVLDTWFDSSISPLFILHWLDEPAFFKANYPVTLRPQGKEIVRTWLYYSLLRCHQLTGAPFKDVWIHNHILDEKGAKMSKSAGNVIDPAELLDRFGAEPFRLWAAAEGNLTETDFMCSFARIQGHEKFLTKLWNIAKLVSNFPDPRTGEGTINDQTPMMLPDPDRGLQPLDLWIRSELSALTARARDRYQGYDFHNPVVELRHFTWETLASHYLELVKPRAYNRDSAFSAEEQAAAHRTLHHCLDTILLLLAPVLPFFTATLYQKLRKRDIHQQPFPAPEQLPAPGFSTAELLELDSLAWNAKKAAGLALSDPVAALTVPEKFKPIAIDLQAAHKAEKLSYGPFALEA